MDSFPRGAVDCTTANSWGSTGKGGPIILTAHEMRIAESVVNGRSNREIAGEMRVTQRTVEFHITNIYRKLGISRRVQLPDALTRLSERDSHPR
ncbi:helix-turn-helix transcriptional regulator [Saccharopolyspora shandongensis]|uniref:response regulator transcription factor n=1 Tax=Saccharopolyspora shandongensis TaxID=418495 RepID=UPI0034260D6B